MVPVKMEQERQEITIKDVTETTQWKITPYDHFNEGDVYVYAFWSCGRPKSHIVIKHTSKLWHISGQI